MQVKHIKVAEGKKLMLNRFPNFSTSGNVVGMKNKYYGEDALLVKCGSYIYNVTSEPSIYNNA